MVRLRIVGIIGMLVMAGCLISLYHDRAIAQEANSRSVPEWVAEIEKVFIRSEDCKQCHERHYEEWKGAREQTPDLKTFGRVDAALLHGTSLESPVFRTVLGLWKQTNPTADEQGRCLSCHVPAVTVFPQHAEKMVARVLARKAGFEGIGCSACHLMNGMEKGLTLAADIQIAARQHALWPISQSRGKSCPPSHAV